MNLRVDLSLPTFSTDGPECPGCGRTYTPDDNHYFDERGYEIDCECGVKFSVQHELLVVMDRPEGVALIETLRSAYWKGVLVGWLACGTLLLAIDLVRGRP